MIIYQEHEKTRIDTKTYKLLCDLTAFSERDMRLRDILSSVLAKNILQAPEAQLLSLVALVPRYKY